MTSNVSVAIETPLPFDNPSEIPLKRPTRSQPDQSLFLIVAAVVSIAALYFGRVVFIPLAFALLFSLILAPVVAFLERLKFKRILAIMTVVLLLLGVTGLVSWITSEQFVELSDQLPVYAQGLQKKITASKRVRNVRLTRLSQSLKQLAQELAQAIPGASPEAVKKAGANTPGSSAANPLAVTVVAPANPLESVESMLGPLVNVLVIAVFTMFILVSREDLRDRFIKLIAGGRRLNVMTRALDETTQRINRYLLLQLLVNVAYGLIVAVALYLIGVPNAPLWGMAAAVLRFLPYIGPPLSAVVPILISVAVFPGFVHALATVGLYVLLELVVGNVVEPIVYGSHVGMSPLAILVAAIFWTLIWGFPGLLLSTPLTVCLVVIGRYAPSLSFLNTILGDEPVLPPHAQFYQRLLAADQGEARQVLERYRDEHSLEDTYSSLLLPALGLAEQDRHRNELDEDSQTFIYQSARELVDDFEDLDDIPTGAEPVPDDALAKTRVLCIPARDDADEITAIMLCQLLVRHGFAARNLSVPIRAGLLRKVNAAAPDVICISALPPFAVEHARTLYGKIREHFPQVPAIICFWQFDGDVQKLTARFKLRAGDHLVTTLPDVLATLEAPGLRQTFSSFSSRPLSIS